MNIKQKILKAFYPVLMWAGKKTGVRATVLFNTQQVLPSSPFYNMHVILNNNTRLPFETLKGKKVLLVNTASDCGYTNQYEHLQKLHEQYKDKLVIVGFPANDFKEQEKGSDDEIASFCKVNFGVTFPLSKKTSVIKSAQQHPVFAWLSAAGLNGWNNQQPSWNFFKYLVNEQGMLTHYFDPSIDPLSEQVVSAINK
jgi:glutathione peroxidase